MTDPQDPFNPKTQDGRRGEYSVGKCKNGGHRALCRPTTALLEQLWGIGVVSGPENASDILNAKCFGLVVVWGSSGGRK